MRKRLWSGTFVDFDRGLNTAINKLRDALGDTAANPRFVETLARRGYRFIGPVKVVEFEAGSQVSAEQHGANLGQPNGANLGQPTIASAPAVKEEESAAPTGPAGLELGAITPSEDELPRPAREITRLLFALVQVMYLVFYIVALVRLQVVHSIVEGWRPEWTMPVVVIVLITAPVGIAVRLYLLAGVAFDLKALGSKFRRLFPLVLPLDQLWALAPFLALPVIGVGAAFATCAALLYLPFSERTLIRMSYRYD
jgi:hypothetical protein